VAPRRPCPIPRPDPTRDGCGGAVVFDARLAEVPLGSSACATLSIASGSPWPIGIRDAARIFREFTGEADLHFDVQGPADSLFGKTYSLVSTSKNRAAQWVEGAVDAGTGMVTSVAYSSQVHDGPGARLVELPAAQASALDYLAAHSVDVTGLVLSSAPTDFGWEFTWEKMAGDVGLPPRVTVTVDWQTNAPIGFRRLVADLGAAPQVLVTRQEAEAAALKSTWLASPKVEASRLRLIGEGDPGPTPVWVVYLSGTGDDPTLPAYIEYEIDAVTGRLE
jgi:hypothetical protein